MKEMTDRAKNSDRKVRTCEANMVHFGANWAMIDVAASELTIMLFQGVSIVGDEAREDYAYKSGRVLESKRDRNRNEALLLS